MEHYPEDKRFTFSIQQLTQSVNNIVVNLGQLVNGLLTGSLILGTRNPTSETFTADQISVNTSATLLAAENTARRYLRLGVPSGGQDLYIGGSGVTASDGYLVPNGEVFEMETTVTTAAVYGVVGAATATISVLEW